MKKTILLAGEAVLLAAAVSAFVYVNNESNSMDELFEANVEALTRNEGIGTKCYKNIRNDPSDVALYCGTCGEIPGRGSNSSFCF